MVLLRHELPDGTSHFDWMIEHPGGQGLVTFRVLVRIDQMGVTQFEAERIGQHRREYLDYEGPVSGGRGEVSRVAMGRVDGVQDDPSRFTVAGALGDARGKWSGVLRDEVWRFEFCAAEW
jgi:hypothetical protein